MKDKVYLDHFRRLGGNVVVWRETAAARSLKISFLQDQYNPGL